jgi:hypothetical protein
MEDTASTIHSTSSADIGTHPQAQGQRGEQEGGEQNEGNYSTQRICMSDRA